MEQWEEVSGCALEGLGWDAADGWGVEECMVRVAEGGRIACVAVWTRWETRWYWEVKDGGDDGGEMLDFEGEAWCEVLWGAGVLWGACWFVSSMN